MKLQGWKSKLPSQVRRLTSINNVIGVISSLYCLLEQVPHRINSLTLNTGCYKA